ncbi:hypothetical protein NA104_22940 [Salmonella sp. NW959]|uniref:hypothetical protein n=1 Tax=unclassified Salmonella TaxID=2614656 RepID=UPI003EC5461C|eukprot:jgi/Chrzof1/14331/UNPLg00604.t1
MKSASVFAVALLAVLAAAVCVNAADAPNERSSNYVGKGQGKGFRKAKIGLLDAYKAAKNAPYKILKENVTADTYTVTYSFKDAATLNDFQAWQYKQKSYDTNLAKYSQKAKVTAAGRKLL